MRQRRPTQLRLDRRPTLVRRSLHDEVTEFLRDRIVGGSMAPGAFINEQELVEQLGISRTPIREALKVLAVEGLVTIVPDRGSYVASLTPEEARDLIEVLAELEGFAAGLACERANRDDVIALKRLQEDAAAAFAARDKLAYSKFNQDLHARIVESAHNAFLDDTHRAYTARLRRVRYLGTPTIAEWEGAVREHAEIVAAIEGRNARIARRLLTGHISRIWPTVRSVLSEPVSSVSAPPADES